MMGVLRYAHFDGIGICPPMCWPHEQSILQRELFRAYAIKVVIENDVCVLFMK